MDSVVAEIEEFLAHPYRGEEMDVLEWAMLTALVVTVAVMWRQYVLKFIVD